MPLPISGEDRRRIALDGAACVIVLAAKEMSAQPTEEIARRIYLGRQIHFIREV